MRKNKLLLLLALLMTAATGAWADTSIVGPEDNLNDGYYSGDHKKNYTLEPGKTITIEFTVSTATDDQLEGDVWNPWYAWAVNFWDGTLNAITVEPRNYGWEANTENNRWTENWVKSWEINYPDDWESGYNFRDNMLQGATVVTTIKRDGADVIIIYDITTTSNAKYRQYVVKTYGDGTKTIWFDLIVNHCHITIDNDKTVTTDTENVVPTYTVSLKDGVKDADKWTVKVGEGQAQALPIGGLKGDGSETVTLQYNGRLKVKGVKATSEAAQAAKPAASVTTAPTGAAIVGVGKTTALVSGGVADGGTLMYAVTTTNTKPASTDGFSDAVPTAKDITASGKVYVWYYVKGDDTHSDSEIAATAIEVPVADIVWDGTNATDLNVEGIWASYEKEGVKLSGNADMIHARWSDYGDPTMAGIGINANETGGFTFTAPTGKAFTKIEMKAQGNLGWNQANLGTGWDMPSYATVTWTGSAASTVKLLTDANNFAGAYVKYIAFYLSE